jgi:hypothetical protein
MQSHPDRFAIVTAMRERRIAGSRSAVWRFFARRNISFKKTLYAAEQKRADVARARRRWMREQGMFDPAGWCSSTKPARIQRWYGSRPRSAWRATCRLRAAWSLEDIHLRGRLATVRNDCTVCDRGSHERIDVPRLREAMPCPNPQARRRMLLARYFGSLCHWCRSNASSLCDEYFRPSKANGPAAEALSGLGRALFYAGALLVSHWAVDRTRRRCSPRPRSTSSSPMRSSDAPRRCEAARIEPVSNPKFLCQGKRTGNFAK